jgi:hypothetical protein
MGVEQSPVYIAVLSSSTPKAEKITVSSKLAAAVTMVGIPFGLS